MKWSGVTWGVPVAPGSQLAGCVPAAAEEVTAVAKPNATGNATAAHTAGAKASSPQVTPVDLLKAVGVGALAFGGIAGVGGGRPRRREPCDRRRVKRHATEHMPGDPQRIDVHGHLDAVGVAQRRRETDGSPGGIGLTVDPYGVAVWLAARPQPVVLVRTEQAIQERRLRDDKVRLVDGEQGGDPPRDRRGAPAAIDP